MDEKWFDDRRPTGLCVKCVQGLYHVPRQTSDAVSHWMSYRAVIICACRKKGFDLIQTVRKYLENGAYTGC